MSRNGQVREPEKRNRERLSEEENSITSDSHITPLPIFLFLSYTPLPSYPLFHVFSFSNNQLLLHLLGFSSFKIITNYKFSIAGNYRLDEVKKTINMCTGK